MPIVKNQHYIFRHYLDAWNIPNTKHIFCLRDMNALNETNTKNVGVERFFYHFPRLSKSDIELIDIIKSGYISNSISKDYIDLITQIVNFYKDRNTNMDQFERFQNFSNWVRDNIGTNDDLERAIVVNGNIAYDYKNEGLEKRYCHAESSGMDGLSSLQKGDISFWNDKDEREKFVYFICNQYLRTKKMRDKVSQGISEVYEKFISKSGKTYLAPLNWDGIAQIICDLSEAKLNYYSFSDKTAVLLRNNTATPYITSDQPVINLCKKFDNNNAPCDFIPYFPISPTYALLISDSGHLPNCEPTEGDVNIYNNYVMLESYKQIYSNKESTLCNLMNEK